MRRVLRFIGVALGLAVLGTAMVPARASSTLERLRALCSAATTATHTHRGAPVVLASGQRAGRHTVSLWASAEPGSALLYVVLAPHAGTPFMAPREVSVRLRNASGDGVARTFAAHADPVRHGARYIAAVPLPTGDTVRAEVVIDGTAGPGDIPLSRASVAPPSPGPVTILLSAAPFFLVAGLWGPLRLVRRSRTSRRPALIPSP